MTGNLLGSSYCLPISARSMFHEAGGETLKGLPIVNGKVLAGGLKRSGLRCDCAADMCGGLCYGLESFHAIRSSSCHADWEYVGEWSSSIGSEADVRGFQETTS